MSDVDRAINVLVKQSAETYVKDAGVDELSMLTTQLASTVGSLLALSLRKIGQELSSDPSIPILAPKRSRR